MSDGTQCTCSHYAWHHGMVTFPYRREPCAVCVRCGDTRCRCVQGPSRCRCRTFTRPEPENKEAGAL